MRLWEVRDRRAGRLSGGMQRRLELASALVHEPSLLLLDEPTAGIDPILRKTIWDELGRLKAEGRTLIITTQYVTEAEGCDAVALIAGGRLVALGTPEQLRREAAGGDVLEAETEGPFDPAALVGKEGIVDARSTGLRSFRIVTEDAGTVTPALDDLVTVVGRRRWSPRARSTSASTRCSRSWSSALGARTAWSPMPPTRGRPTAPQGSPTTGRRERLVNPFTGAAKIATRLLAFIGRELIEVRRRPGVLASLVFGPFLVMAIFGLGYNGYKKPLPTLLVIPPESGLPAEVEAYQGVAGAGLEIVEVVPDDTGVNERLESGEIAVVGIAPANARDTFESGQQSDIEIRIDVADPVQAAYASLMANEFSNAVNQEIIRRAAEEGQAEAEQRGVPDTDRIPPEVIAAPTRAEVVNIAPEVPDVVGYFAPAVLALILQHMAVTLIALSVVRDRLSGTMELFRVSPVSAWEVVAGKILGFGVLCAAIAVLSLVLLIVGLNVPMLGSVAALAGVVALLILASLGLGLLISIVSDSERQAVQLSLLVLLASVFFSGFVLPISEFNTPVRVAAYLIPVTNGIDLIQDVMLRGTIRDPWQAWLLAAIGLVLLLACWLLLRRGMSRA